MLALHVCDGWEPTNGAAKVARLLSGEQEESGFCTKCGRWFSVAELRQADEVWIHCGWKPCLWWAALWARKSVRMPHGSYDPVRLSYRGWKKRLVGMVERWTLRRASKVVATCEAEASWIRAYEPGVRRVEVTDLRRFFDFGVAAATSSARHVLYLGRRHPLKGVEYLEKAAAQVPEVELRIVSDHRGAELEADWTWCDVLVLPTLSDNFGLVVAEALSRGKRVVVTDGAPAWEPPLGGDADFGGRLRYLRDFCAAPSEERVRLLRQALR